MEKTDIIWCIVILNMYKSIKSCVMNNGVQSECFDSHAGLRQ